MKYFFCIVALLLGASTFAQKLDSLVVDSASGRKVMVYQLNNQLVYYPKPKPFQFLWRVPRTFGGVAKESFNKKSLPAWGVIAGTTAAFLAFDQKMVNGVQQFSRYINLDNTRRFKDVSGFKVGSQKVHIYQAPQNINSAIYQIGEGLPSLAIAGGLAIYGNITNDYRSRSTASQMGQTFIVMGVATQLLKRVFGRESPFRATQDGGTWRPFTNWGTYQKNVSRYDAFPSGHMATMMATVTVLSQNYPEKRWIKTVGYSVMSLVGLSMMNNGVHWASDYPLAIGLGYVVGKVTVNMNRWIKGEKKKR